MMDGINALFPKRNGTMMDGINALFPKRNGAIMDGTMPNALKGMEQ